MVSFTFNGFAQGSPVDISVDQDTLSAADSVLGWGTSLTIQHHIPGADIAPSVVWFEATAPTGFTTPGPGPGEVYDARKHDITYLWDFGDGANAAPTTALNIPDAWKSLNTASGQKVAHVFNDPGTYTVTLWALEVATGRRTRATQDVTIADPDVVFPSTQTILYDPLGVGDGATYPGADVQTTFAGCITARAALGATPARILLKRGEVISDLSSIGVNNLFWSFNSLSNFRLGAWGAGARPVLSDPEVSHYFRLSGYGADADFMLYDLDLRGGWDAARETGRKNAVFFQAFGAAHDAGSCYAVHRCDISGFDDVHFGYDNGVSDGAPFYWTVSDTAITGWRDYGFSTETPLTPTNTHFAFIGSAIFQNVDALNGGPKNGLYNNHGAIRLGYANTVYIGVTDLFNRTGWGAENGCLRLQTSPLEGNENYLDRVAVEGLIEMHRDATGGGNQMPGNTVVDKLLHWGGATVYDGFFAIHGGGTTVRNYLGILGDVPYNQNAPGLFIHIYAGNQATNIAAPVSIHNCTFLDLRSDAHAPWPSLDIGEQIPFTNYTKENNIHHAPNRTGANQVVGNAPIDTVTAIAGFTPRHKGVLWGFDYNSGSFPSDLTSPSGSFSVPYSEIYDRRVFQTSTTPTTQAYWQALPDTDHMLFNNATGALYRAQDGDFSVSFDASEVTLTNTSGVTWGAGQNFTLKLDRQSLLGPMDGTYSSTGETVPLPLPQAGSPAIDAGDAGQRAYSDFLGAVRPGPGTPDHTDTARAASGNERGAVLEN